MSFLTAFRYRTFHSAITEIIMSKNEVHTKYFFGSIKTDYKYHVQNERNQFFSVIRYKDRTISYISSSLA